MIKITHYINCYFYSSKLTELMNKCWLMHCFTKNNSNDKNNVELWKL